MAVSLWLMVAPLAMVLFYHPPGVRRGWPTAVFATCGAALMLESVYRVVGASVMSGWILSQQAVDVLLFMPEAIVLIAFVLLDFDEMAGVCLVGRRSDDHGTAQRTGARRPRALTRSTRWRP